MSDVNKEVGILTHDDRLYLNSLDRLNIVKDTKLNKNELYTALLNGFTITNEDEIILHKFGFFRILSDNIIIEYKNDIFIIDPTTAYGQGFLAFYKLESIGISPYTGIKIYVAVKKH